MSSGLARYQLFKAPSRVPEIVAANSPTHSAVTMTPINWSQRHQGVGGGSVMVNVATSGSWVGVIALTGSLSVSCGSTGLVAGY